MSKKNSLKITVSKLIKNQPFATSILILLFAVLFVTILWEINFFEKNQFITIIGVIFSASITIFITFIQLDRNREENRINREHQTRKEFMIYTFKEIIPSIRLLRDSLSQMNAFYISIPINLRLNIESPMVFKFDTPEIRQKLLLEKVQVSRCVAEFLTSFECLEISMYDLRKYKNILAGKLNSFLETGIQGRNSEHIETLLSKISGIYHKRASYLDELQEAIDELSEKIIEFEGWLYDFVIILQNHFLSDVFNKKLSKRKTLDPKYKILTEIVSQTNSTKDK